jgi:hypothetical protein
MTDSNVEIVDTDDDPYRDLRAKPEDRFTGGIPVEEMFGLCADEFDDEFMESMAALRRGEWPKPVSNAQRVNTRDFYRDLPSAKPEERLTGGMPVERCSACARTSSMTSSWNR